MVFVTRDETSLMKNGKEIVMRSVLESPGRINLRATDVSRQNMAEVRDVPSDSTVGELVSSLISQMNLPRNDPSGRTLTYHARSAREGRHLHASETVGGALRVNDHIVLLPNIDAGAGV